MLFDIINGIPYLICGDTAYRVEIINGQVKYDSTAGMIAEAPGRYSLQEVMSKIGKNVKNKTKRGKKSDSLTAEDETEAL